MDYRLRTIIILAIIFFYEVAIGQGNNTRNNDISMIPADLSASEKSLEKKILFPNDSFTQTIFIRCETYITEYGKFRGSFCYPENPDYIEYERAILIATKTARAKPAMINGKNIRVWIPFSVLFHHRNNANIINVLPNHLIHLKQYGAEYSAPQRYNRIRIHCNQRLKRPLRILQEVGNNGIIRNVNIIYKSAVVPCKNIIIRRYTDFKYIPAKSNGNFVDGTIDEYLFSCNNVVR